MPSGNDTCATALVAEVFVTDTVAQAAGEWPQLRVVPVAPLAADAIERVVTDRPSSDPF